jgi:hypothetical protein
MVAPRAGLPDPLASRAVLVGVSDYTSLERLPAVANNVATLQRVITDADLWGLPDEHCVTLLNPTSVDEVLDAVHAAASAASDALLFYFAGHGLLDDRSELYLALPGSDEERLYRAVRYDDVRREVVVTARACYGKVVLLDCCYSGRALQGGMSGSVELADHARVDGSYVMTASAETSAALAPPGEEYTAFTGALVDKLLHGLRDGPDLLDMETLFYHVRADLQARHCPVPQQRARNDGRAIALVRNRRGRGTPARSTDVPVRVLPEPPPGFEGFLRWRPTELDNKVWALRTQDQHQLADQLLAASAARRADQEVAAIIDRLRGQRRTNDVRQVIKAAARRPSDEVLRIVDALQYTDMPDEASNLLRAVGAGPVGDVASVAHLLQVGQRPDDLATLLDAALDFAQRQSSLIDLVNALWVAGLREEVDGLIERAVSKLPGPAVVRLADELREVGREEAAFGLYAGAADTVTTQPPEVVAQLSQAMASAGRTADSERIATALASTAVDVTSLLDVATSFWDAGLNNHADVTLTRAAETLPNDDIMALAVELWARHHDDAAHHLCLQAMLNRPATAVQEIVTLLHETGHPVSARRLLETVASQVPVRTVFDLLKISTDADRQRIFHKVIEREPNDVAELLDALNSTQSRIAIQLTDLIVTRVESRTDLLPITIEHFDPENKKQVLASMVTSASVEELVALLRELPGDEANLLMLLTIQKGDPPLKAVISLLRARALATDPDPVLDYLLEQPLDQIGPLLAGLRNAGLDDYVDALLSRLAKQRGWDSFASDIASLFRMGAADAGKQLLDTVFTGRNYGELKALVSALRRHDQTAALDAAAFWVRNTYTNDSHLDYILREIGLGEYAHRRFWKKRKT